MLEDSCKSRSFATCSSFGQVVAEFKLSSLNNEDSVGRVSRLVDCLAVFKFYFG